MQNSFFFCLTLKIYVNRSKTLFHSYLFYQILIKIQHSVNIHVYDCTCITHILMLIISCVGASVPQCGLEEELQVCRGIRRNAWTYKKDGGLVMFHIHIFSLPFSKAVTDMFIIINRICPFIHLTIYSSVCPSILLIIHLFIYSSICPSIH